VLLYATFSARFAAANAKRTAKKPRPALGCVLGEGPGQAIRLRILDCGLKGKERDELKTKVQG
ncbi:MAG: hypothetical protein L6R28_13860, partial [Planctomycetes bacterium]|nr:hypothetical protein [Planctomycetota bacterium]